MRVLLAAGILTTLGLGPPAPVSAGEAKGFDAPGLFSIAAPGEGFVWSELQAFEVEGTKGRIYGCTKPGSTTCAVLGLEQRLVDSEARKVATLKAHYNVLVQTWKKAGYTDIAGKKPSLKPPIPARVAYTATAKALDGPTVYLGGVTLFKRNVYAFQAFAATDEERDALFKCLDSLKEKTP